MAPSSLTPEQRSLRAQIAAGERWGRVPTEQRRAATDRCRRSFLDRFLDEVDRENPGLPDGERSKLADAKLRAHMSRLALKSSRSRSRAATATADAEEAERELSGLDGAA